jgi:hypothetical protein
VIVGDWGGRKLTTKEHKEIFWIMEILCLDKLMATHFSKLTEQDNRANFTVCLLHLNRQDLKCQGRKKWLFQKITKSLKTENT